MNPWLGISVKNKRNYYRILHVQPDAPEAIIRASYRTLMQKLRAHPDLGGDQWNAAVINEAFATLTNTEARAAYDSELFKRYSRAELGAQHNGGRRAGPARERPQQSSGETPASGASCRFCKAPHHPRPGDDSDHDCPRCASPLSAPRQERDESPCQRAVARLEKAAPLAFYRNWPQRRPFQGRIEDLSTRGLRFATRVGLEQGEIIKLESPLLAAVGQISNTTALRRMGRYEFVYGVLFHTLRFAYQRGTFVQTQA